MAHKPQKGRDHYEVGYGKPPKKHQFPKGQSGNRKGRPEGSRNFKTEVKETLKMPVSLKEQGQNKRVSTQKAALMRLRERALNGDQRALDRLLDLARTYNGEDAEAEAAEALTPDDQAVLDNYLARNSRNTVSNDDAPKDEPSNDDGSAQDDGQPGEGDDDAWLR